MLGKNTSVFLQLPTVFNRSVWSNLSLNSLSSCIHRFGSFPYFVHLSNFMDHALNAICTFHWQKKREEDGDSYRVESDITKSVEQISELNMKTKYIRPRTIKWRLFPPSCFRCCLQVIIISHIPPGTHEMETNATFALHKPYNDHFIEYIRNYSDVISTVLSGYEHLDTFRVVLDESCGSIKYAWCPRVYIDILLI